MTFVLRTVLKLYYGKGPVRERENKMNYIVFDAEGRDWKSTPEVFRTLEEAQARLAAQNERFANSNPFVIRQLVEVVA